MLFVKPIKTIGKNNVLSYFFFLFFMRWQIIFISVAPKSKCQHYVKDSVFFFFFNLHVSHSKPIRPVFALTNRSDLNVILLRCDDIDKNSMCIQQPASCAEQFLMSFFFVLIFISLITLRIHGEQNKSFLFRV